MLNSKYRAILLAAIFISSVYLSLNYGRGYSISNSTQPLDSSTNITKTSDNFQNATKYQLVKIWGSKGTKDGQFNRPHDSRF